MKAIIFDFDGVIHNTFHSAYNIRFTLNPEVTMEDFRASFEGNILKNVKNYDNYDKFRALEWEVFKELKLEKEIRSELEELSRKYDLYIISSNTSKNIDLYFENNNFTNIFKEILAAEIHTSKVEKFKMLFEKYGLDENSCIFVTDTSGDIREASHVGVRSIACTFGYHEEERLKKADPFIIINDFSQIRKTVEEITRIK